MVEYKFTQSEPFDLLVPQGILEYLAGVDPSREWEIRGVSGKNSENLSAYKDQKIQQVKKFIKSNEWEDKISDFLGGVKPIYDALKNVEHDKINDFLGEKDFYFVIGPPRSAGTYLYTQISEIVNWPWKNLLRSLTHDHLPLGNHIRGSRNLYGSFGWRRPKRFKNILFQFAMFIEYGNREAPESDAYVLKSMPLCHGLQILDLLFEDRAHYIVTVRHPAAVSASRAEGKNLKNSSQFKEECFTMWFNLYAEVVRDGVPEEDLQLLKFGESMDQYLESLVSEKGEKSAPDGIDKTERNYNESFWEQKKFQEKIQWIEDIYYLHGIEFPMPEQIM